jgi:Major tropism determinant N-terminal domain
MAAQTILQFRRGTAALWASQNPVLAAGEFGYETDTNKGKIGNGTTAYNSLGYVIGTTAASTLTGTTLASNVLASSLTSVGTLTSLAVTGNAVYHMSVNAQSGTAYTLSLSDDGTVITTSNSSANTISIPTNATVPFAIGTQITVIQIGSGQTTIQAVASGTTTVGSVGTSAIAPKLRVVYSSATLLKVGTDTWYVIGDII